MKEEMEKQGSRQDLEAHQTADTVPGQFDTKGPVDTYTSLEFAAGVSPAQLYALQVQQNFLQRQLMYHKLTSPAPLLPHQQSLAFANNYPLPSAASIAVPQALPVPMTISSALVPSETLVDIPDNFRQGKRKRSERSLLNSELRLDVEESDEESSGSVPTKRSKMMMPCGDLNASETVLSDITELLSLPQKEAAQRLGISESMLCKRFKECTRRKWPFRYLRKIEKTIASLQSQKEVEPLSPEDQERLDELLKQRLECLAPVKIRITKSPSPISCARSPLAESDSTTTMDYDSDSDSPSEGYADADYETEAVEQLINLSRCATPRFFMAPQIAY